MRKRSNFARLGLTLGFSLSLIAGAAKAETITVTHWGGQFYGVPYAVAMEKGFFKKHGRRRHRHPDRGRRRHRGPQHAGRRHSVRRGLAGRRRAGDQCRAEARHRRRRRPDRGRPDVGGEEGFAADRHQGPGRQADRLHRAGLGQQHGHPDGAEGQRHDAAAGQAGAGRRSRRQSLRRDQRRGRCRLLRRADLRPEQGAGAAAVLGAGRDVAQDDADRAGHDDATTPRPIPTWSRA